MGEKRKPAFIFLLRYPSKKAFRKLEVFDAELWKNKLGLGVYYPNLLNRYRLRVDGAWFSPNGKHTFFTKNEIKDLLFRSLKF